MTSDFRDHIQIYHREEYVKVENEEPVLKNKRQQDRKRRNHIKALVSPVAGPSKQQKMDAYVKVRPSLDIKTASQMKEACRRHFLDDMLPISTVKSPAFIQLVKSFRSDIVVPCRRIMTHFIICNTTILTILKTELRKVVVKTKNIFQLF